MSEVALIGCGRVTERQHAAVYHDPASDVRAVTLVDPSFERRELLGATLGIPSERRFAGHADLLASDPPPFAVVATPSRTHAPIVTALLEAGTSVVCEKPLSPLPAECAALVRCATRTGKGLAVLHNYATASPWLHALEAIESGAIGTPLAFEVTVADDGPLPGAPEAEPMWRLDPERSGGGCLIDSGYHYVYLAELVLRAPVTGVRAAAIRTCAPGRVVEDYARVTLEHATGATSDLCVSWSAAAHEPAQHTIFGSRGRVSIDEDAAAVELHASDGGYRVTCDADPEGFRTALPAAIASIGDAATATMLAAAGERIVRIIAACYRVAETGRSESIA